METNCEYPKIPRWISTESGQWAWRECADWRGTASSALSVQDRSKLLQDAESRWAEARSAAQPLREIEAQ
ncbi:hypothetical protein F8S13_06685 [Chloroflexia bacterium SDU3-3]|nr:hypothetical protein F8S13_06685 [Chloroflexia bacterium SDU3-3]